MVVAGAVSMTIPERAEQVQMEKEDSMNLGFYEEPAKEERQEEVYEEEEDGRTYMEIKRDELRA